MRASQEELLRGTISSMSSGVRGMEGLAATAIARGKRIRRRQRSLAVAAAAVIVALVSVVTIPMSRPDRPMAPLTADGAIVPGGWVIKISPQELSVQSGLLNRVLKADAGPVTSPSGVYQMTAQPAADGFNVVITKDGAGRTVTFEAGAEAFQWAPDRDSILATLSNVDSQKGFAIVDAATGAVSTHLPVDIPTSFCGACTFSWQANGTEVVIRQGEDFTDASGAFTGRGSTYFFDAATGKPSRILPVQVNVTGPGSWSPDGRYALSDDPGGAMLIDLQTRTMVRQLPGRAWFVPDGFLLVIQDLGGGHRSILEMRPDGTVIATIPLGGELTLHPVILAPH